MENKDAFQDLNPVQKANLLTELNVVNSVVNVSRSVILQNAWNNGQEVSVRGYCYGIHDGLLVDMGICIEAADDLENISERLHKLKTKDF